MDRADLSQLNMFIRTFYVDVECIVLGGVIERIARYVHLGPWDSIKIARLITLIWDSWSQMPVELFLFLTEYRQHRRWIPKQVLLYGSTQDVVGTILGERPQVFGFSFGENHTNEPCIYPPADSFAYGPQVPQAWRTKWIPVVNRSAKLCQVRWGRREKARKKKNNNNNQRARRPKRCSLDKQMQEEYLLGSL